LEGIIATNGDTSGSISGYFITARYSACGVGIVSHWSTTMLLQTGTGEVAILSAVSSLKIPLTMNRLCVPHNNYLLQVVWLISFEF
jgi:hypothetical protein